MKTSPIIHALPYPALEAGNRSYPKGDYTIETKAGGDGYSVDITHQISNAPLLATLIERGEAQFGCFLSIPKVGIRRLLLADADVRKQRVEWNDSIDGEPPKLRPVLIYTGDDREQKLTKKDGVAKIWQGQKISLIKGARLARYAYLNVNSSKYGLLRFMKENEYPKGSFTVEANTEEGFYFSVKAAPDIFNFVQNAGDNQALRHAILTNAVARCFEILKSKYAETEDDGNQDYENLRILSDKLHAEFGYDWNDDQFDPSEIATRLYPLQVPEVNPDEESE